METQAIYTVDVTMDGVQRMDTIPQPMPASLEVLCGRVALLCRQIQQLTNSIHVDYPRFQVRAPQFRELFDGMDGVKEKHMEGEYNLHRSIEIGAPYIGARGVTFTSIDKESWNRPYCAASKSCQI